MRLIAAYHELLGLVSEEPLGPIPGDDRDRIDYHRAERALRRAQALPGPQASPNGLALDASGADAVGR